jgi:hypothetical protein
LLLLSVPSLELDRLKVFELKVFELKGRGMESSLLLVKLSSFPPVFAFLLLLPTSLAAEFAEDGREDNIEDSLCFCLTFGEY